MNSKAYNDKNGDTEKGKSLRKTFSFSKDRKNNLDNKFKSGTGKSKFKKEYTRSAEDDNHKPFREDYKKNKKFEPREKSSSPYYEKNNLDNKFKSDTSKSKFRKEYTRSAEDDNHKPFKEDYTKNKKFEPREKSSSSYYEKNNLGNKFKSGTGKSKIKKEYTRSAEDDNHKPFREDYTKNKKFEPRQKSSSPYYEKNNLDNKFKSGTGKSKIKKEYTRSAEDDNHKPFKEDYKKNKKFAPREKSSSSYYEKNNLDNKFKSDTSKSKIKKEYTRSAEDDNHKPFKENYKKNKKFAPREKSSNSSWKKNEFNFDRTRFVKEDNIIPLNKYIAHCGICSRRKAAEIVSTGDIKVNDKSIVEPGFKIDSLKDKVFYKGKLLQLKEELVYILLNKPKDYITTNNDPQERKTVFQLIQGATEERVFPVGRLDRNTTGVLLITNDGDLTQKLTHPQFYIKKIYQVSLNKDLTKKDFETILQGVQLEDGISYADALAYVDPKLKTEIGIEIHSGKNRIVRRLFESLGYEIIALDRVLFGGLTKKNVRRSKWRFLTEKEIRALYFLNSGKLKKQQE